MAGKIIILNGASCAGKSSISGELKNILTDFYHLKLDDFTDSVPSSFYAYSKEESSKEIGYCFKLSEDKTTVLDYSVTAKGYRVIESIHSAISAFCKENINVIYDTVIFNDEIMASAAQKFSEHQVLFVAVRCSEEKRKEREMDRGHPISGMHKINADFIYQKCQYDAEVDATSTTALEAATEIARQLDWDKPSVFQNTLKKNV